MSCVFAGVSIFPLHEKTLEDGVNRAAVGQKTHGQHCEQQDVLLRVMGKKLMQRGSPRAEGKVWAEEMLFI